MVVVLIITSIIFGSKLCRGDFFQTLSEFRNNRYYMILTKNKLYLLKN